MKLSPTVIIPLILSTLLAVFCVGCAVMTIDVDVYKGPLVNHQDVQIEQMAARAIGAKPLLMQLRTELEKQEDITYSPDRRDANSPQPKYEFKNHLAVSVDAVISLYEDQGILQPKLQLVLENAEHYLKEYKKSFETFRPRDINLAESKWDSISKGFYNFLRTKAVSDIPADHPALKELPPGDDREFIVGSIKRLKAGYKELLTKARLDRRPIKEILKNHNFIQHRLAGIADNNALIKNISVLGAIDAEIVNDASSNALFLLAAREDVIRAHAELLFPPQKRKLRMEFERLALTASKAFIDARSALEGLLVATLKLIVVINTEYSSPEFDKQKATKRATEFAIELIEEAHILAVLYMLKTTDETSELFKELDEKASHVKEWFLQELPVALDPEVDRYWRLTNGARLVKKSYHHSDDLARDLFKRTLLELMKKTPIRTAEALLHIHKVFIKSDNFGKVNVVKDCGLPYRYQRIKARRFGLAIGPVLDFDRKDYAGEQLTDQVINDRRYVRFNSFVEHGWDYARDIRQSSFGRGRLNRGIESLIEKYVSTAYYNPSSRPSDEKRAERDRLTSALVRFAEKILFVANNSELLTLNPDGSQSHSETQTIRSYIMVLQAIGNSILIQADELRHREANDKSQTDSWAREQQALNHAYPYPLPSLPKSEKVTVETSKDVLDQLIAVLRYEHIKATSECGKDDSRTRNIATALKLAYEQRADMVYIRPSSAYLRSSYPATTLQGNSGQAWQNMLLRHGLRQAPLLGELFEHGDKSQKQQLQLQQEIDKQFWQNINRVRVAGSGNINYVIAKDDIGNWYVKSYSANPESIIKSARNLAMFNLGPELGAEALERLSGEGETSKDKRLTWRERQLKNYRAKFNAQTLQQHNELKQQADDLPKMIETRWQEVLGNDAIKEELTKALEEANSALKNVVDPSNPKKDSILGQIVVDRLRAILRFHRALASRLSVIQSAHRSSQASNERKIEELRSAVENAGIASGEAKERRDERKRTHDFALKLKQLRDVNTETPQTRAQVRADESQTKIDLDNAESIVKEREDAFIVQQNILNTEQPKLEAENEQLNANITLAEKAGGEAAKILYSVVSRFAEGRSASVHAYETAITVLGGDGK